jgi:predicted transcriptional regulator
MPETEQADLTTLTVELLSAFVSNNTMESSDLAGLIQSTHTALVAINAPSPVEPPAPEFEPAVTVRKSLGSRDHILSLIDGKPYKTLKRHLSGHGLTPEEYRERYKLAADYPMVAPSYSEHRRNVAQRLGLGRKSIVASAAEATAIADEPEAAVSETKPSGIAAAEPASKAAAISGSPKAASAKAEKAPSRRASKSQAPAPTDADVPSTDAAADAQPVPLAKVKPTKKVALGGAEETKAKRVASATTKRAPKAAPAQRGRPKAEGSSEPAE